MEQIDWIKEQEKKTKILEDLAKWLDDLKGDPLGTMHNNPWFKDIKNLNKDETRHFRRLMRKHGKR
jgi:hypothetical protein